MADPIQGTFRQPFAEQVAALRIRLANLVPTAKWDDLLHDQHDRAFVVAGAVKADLLADLAKAVEKAIAEGTGFDAFKGDFRALVEKHGWHGWTGEGTAKGEAWRMRVIYRTNMATSYAAGRMAQLIDGKFKFWVYKHGNALEPRLQHLAWDGVALPPDHPFWAEHFPPNDWGCTCRVFGARTDAGIKRVGGQAGKDLPEGWRAIDPKTGAPEGIGKGWAYAPGASVADEINALLARKSASLPPPLARDLAASAAPKTGDILPPRPSTPEEAIALGRQVAGDLRKANAQLDADWASGSYERAAESFKKDLFAKLASHGDVGKAVIDLTATTERRAGAVMDKVARVLPTDWVRAGNAIPLRVQLTVGRGSYQPESNGLPATILTDASSTSVHEYLHHLQFALPELDRLFQELHRLRTANDPLVALSYHYPDEVGRPDGYFSPYQGREYRGFGAMEVLTMALQPVLGSDETARRMLEKMMRQDPEMLEFALGVLFYWRR